MTNVLAADGGMGSGLALGAAPVPAFGVGALVVPFGGATTTCAGAAIGGGGVAAAGGGVGTGPTGTPELDWARPSAGVSITIAARTAQPARRTRLVIEVLATIRNPSAAVVAAVGALDSFQAWA
jgi:hypothetical protein